MAAEESFEELRQRMQAYRLQLQGQKTLRDLRATGAIGRDGSFAAEGWTINVVAIDQNNSPTRYELRFVCELCQFSSKRRFLKAHRQHARSCIRRA